MQVYFLTLQSLGDGVLDAALLARYEDVARPENLRWPDWRAGQLDKATTSIDHLEAEPALLGGPLTIRTIAVACALWYLDLRFPDFDWRAVHPKVGAWYEEARKRPSLGATWSL